MQCLMKVALTWAQWRWKPFQAPTSSGPAEVWWKHLTMLYSTHKSLVHVVVHIVSIEFWLFQHITYEVSSKWDIGARCTVSVLQLLDEPGQWIQQANARTRDLHQNLDQRSYLDLYVRHLCCPPQECHEQANEGGQSPPFLGAGRQWI